MFGWLVVVFLMAVFALKFGVAFAFGFLILCLL